jgi:hypothetical protein
MIGVIRMPTRAVVFANPDTYFKTGDILEHLGRTETMEPLAMSHLVLHW